MKKQINKSQMADLQFVDFPFMPGPVRKEMQFKQPCDFSKIDVATLSGMSHPVSGFPAVFHNADGPMFGDPQNVLYKEGEARNHEKFQHFRSQR